MYLYIFILILLQQKVQRRDLSKHIRINKGYLCLKQAEKC